MTVTTRITTHDDDRDCDVVFTERDVDMTGGIALTMALAVLAASNLGFETMARAIKFLDDIEGAEPDEVPFGKEDVANIRAVTDSIRAFLAHREKQRESRATDHAND